MHEDQEQEVKFQTFAIFASLRLCVKLSLFSSSDWYHSDTLTM